MSDFYISLEPDTPLVNFEIGVPGPSGSQGATGPQGPRGLDAATTVVTGNTTADFDYQYNVVANAVISDPAIPDEGKSYTVFVINGTATVGGVAYSDEGSFIRRYYEDGQWHSKLYRDSTAYATAAQGTDERVPTAAGLTSKFSTAKATPVDNDRVAIFDSAASNAPKHTLWSSVKSTLKSYFDTVYAAIVHTHLSADITDASVGALDESVTDVVAKFDNYGGLTATSINTNGVSIYPTGTLSLASTNVGGSITLNGEAATDGRTIEFPDASGTLALTSDITDAVTSNTTSDGTCDLDVASLITGSVNFNTAVTSATAGVGELNWNDSDGTLNLGLKGGNVTLQIGQESVARVVNKTGANLLESQYRVVRIRSTAEGGAQGQRLAVVLAQANNDPNSVDTLGLVTENINVNEEGFVTTSGLVRGINTTGSLQGESWVAGDVLYLSPTTAGQLTNVKPQAPQHTVIVGFVVYAHNSQGKIYVKVDNGYELDELHNVRIVDAFDGEVLLFNGTENVWQNFMLVPASIGLGNVDNTSDLDKPISTATQDALDLKADWSNPVRTTLTGDGTTTVFAISGAGSLTNPAALIVAIDGVLQESGVDYSVSGGNITFTDPLASGAKAVVISPTNTVQIGEVTPSDGSVTSSKLDPNLTLTNMTVTGAAAFTSTTRPTSAGTGTPAATSLITRADGDARFLLKPFVGILSTAVNSDTNTTTYKTVTELQTTLAAGTYQIEAFLIHDGNTNYLTSGVKDRINVISGSATAAGFVYRVFDNATTATTFPSGRVSTNPLVESAPTNRSQSTLRTGILTVTSTAVIAVQIAQTAAVAASNTTLQVGSYLKITPL